jgi:hypothetical protein
MVGTTGYLAEKIADITHLTRNSRQESIELAMRKDGFNYDDVHSSLEVYTAFSQTGYTNIGSYSVFLSSENTDMIVDGRNVAFDVSETRADNISFGKLNDFKNLIVDASMLSLAKPRIDVLMERLKPQETLQPLPEYQETESMYMLGNSDSDGDLAEAVRAMRYATTFKTPHLFYFANEVAHAGMPREYEINGVIYKARIGNIYVLDENGNIYQEPLEDPYDPLLYYPQHIYAVRQMLAQVDTIIAFDPNAVIVIQGDHGIHLIGQDGDFDSDYMYAKGYSLEDQLNLNLQVISAVRIPPQYGELTEPLDPLDITRYLVNHFVGNGNYEYLYYQKDGNQP